MREELYIIRRKIWAFINSIFFYIFRIFPINDRLVSVCSFEGKGGFGCNPKYIVEKMHEKYPDIRFVWLVNDIGKPFPKYIRKVPNTILSRAYWLSISKVWIDNYRKPYGAKKRKGQYYLNVNHYTIGIKCTGPFRGNRFSKMAYIVSKNDSHLIDGLVIDSGWCEKVLKKAMVYDGRLLKTGAPRGDVLYRKKEINRKIFRCRHGLKEDAKVVMYAPTFREGARNGKRFVYSQKWTINLDRIIKSLESRFDDTWYVCIRVHPQLAGEIDMSNSLILNRVIDESKNDDMYELLAGMDAYITDYSSAIFEAGYMHIPAFIYADDINEYVTARGNLYWEFENVVGDEVRNNKELTPDMDLLLPFPIAHNNDEIENYILNFDYGKYEKKLETFHKDIGLVFDGNACDRLVRIIAEQIKN